MEPKVTVLTTVYNGLPYLREAIESTLSQTYSNFEYLIIDDASTDESAKCILSYRDPRIRFVRNKKNLGTSDTINRGLSLIRTPYVVRLDQDDVSLPNRVEEQIQYLETHSDIAIVCSWEHTIDSNGNKVRDCKRIIKNYGEFLGPVLLGLCPIWHPSIAFRKDIMEKIGGFNADYARAEDFEVTARFALKRYGAAIVPRYHLLQREHDNRQSVQFNNKQVSVTRKIHNQALASFSNDSYIEQLGYFLRLEKDPDKPKFDKKYLANVYRALNDLLNKVRVKQKLSLDEYKSLKRVIYRRIGLGIRFFPALSHFPDWIFYPSFYFFSPLHLHRLKSILSRLYNFVLELRYVSKVSTRSLREDA